MSMYEKQFEMLIQNAKKSIPTKLPLSLPLSN